MKKEKTLYFPITINKEDWRYWGEAKFFEWCFSQWKSLDEYANNMTDAIWEYSSSINEWFFEVPNTAVLWINLDENGRIKGNFLKEINKDTYMTLSWS
jgi:predicted RNase H-like HicB family nuclease